MKKENDEKNQKKKVLEAEIKKLMDLRMSIERETMRASKASLILCSRGQSAH